MWLHIGTFCENTPLEDYVRTKINIIATMFVKVSHFNGSFILGQNVRFSLSLPSDGLIYCYTKASLDADIENFEISCQRTYH